MKKIKLLLLISCISIISGCFNKKAMEDANIRVSSYPIEYITQRLYSKHSTIKSIYPDDMIEGYKVSDKLLKDYSSTDLFIFNGNSDEENDYVYKMFMNNKKLKIIDSTASLSINYKQEELWLDPMNYLTMANNIKKGFNEYADIAYLKDDVNENFKSLKQDLVQLEADYREMAERANNKTIIVSDDVFLYLKKYGLNVISLDKNNKSNKKSLFNTEDLIKNGTVKTIFVKKGQKVSDNINKLKDDYKISIEELNTMSSMTNEDRKNGKDYLSIMHDNIETLKQELYK